MNCKELEKKIPSFLDRSMSDEELTEFIQHVETCDQCREELSIQLLVLEGMEKLESGTTFNLQYSVQNRVAEGKNQIFKGLRFKRILYVLEILIICGLGACFWLCFYAR